MTFRAMTGWCKRWPSAARAVLLCALFGSGAVSQSAAPSSESYVRNQAMATYRDGAVESTRQVLSNTVEALIQQTGAFTLASSQTRTAKAGDTVYFPHVLTNTGNGTDEFPLSVAAGGTPGGLGLGAVSLHADADGDGRPDSTTPITTTGMLPQGAGFRFVVAAVVPGAAVVGQQASLVVRAEGSAGVRVAPAQTNTDTVTVADPDAVDLVLAKAASAASFTVGFEGSYTLTVRNQGRRASGGTLTVSDPLPAGMSFVTVGSGGSGWTCTETGRTVNCSTSQVIPAGGAASALRIVVAVSEPAARASQPVVNTATVSGGGEPAANVANNSASASVTVGLAASVSGKVWLDADHDDRYRAGEPLLDGWRIDVLRMVNGEMVVVKSGVSGSAGGHGSYRIDGLEPGEGYMLRFIDPNSNVVFANPVDGESGTPVSKAKQSNGWLVDIALKPGDNVAEQSLPLDPSGVVYDSETRQPVAGAVVSIVGPAGFVPADHLFGGAANEHQTTGTDGFYQFILVGNFPSGVYTLQVKEPAGYLPFSEEGSLRPATTVGACDQVHCLNPDGRETHPGILEVLPSAAPPAVGQPHTYFLRFRLSANPLSPNVFNNHIPVDPQPRTSLSLRKSASRAIAEIGDFVDYTLEVRNATALPIVQPVTLTDWLPFGFTYQAGTARLDGKPLADPVRATERSLRFDMLPPLAGSQSYKVSYRLRVGAGAMQGDGINRARATAGDFGSMTAQAKVTVQGGVFSEKAYVVGRVYVECNRDRVQNEGEPGIPGARVYLEDGTFAITDADGKFSFYGVSPRTHVLKLDMTSMPVGSELVVLGNRNAGDPGSRFVDVSKGELHKANFAEGSCTPEILQQVQARQAKGEVFVAETDKQLEAKVAASGRPVAQGDVKALPAAGLMAGDRQVPNFAPLLPPSETTGPGEAGLPAPREGAVRAAPTVNLDVLMRELDNKVGFIDHKDGDTLPYTQATVRVKGRAGLALLLSVNGEEQAATRVGSKAVLAERQIEIWEYVGVELKPGHNTLELVAKDPFGNVRGTSRITVIAPDRLGRLRLVLPSGVPVADGHTPVKIGVELSDAEGVPVTVRTPLTLEASLGRWDVKDLDPVEPGVQVFVEGGKASFPLLAPQAPGEAMVRVVSGVLKSEERLAFVPELRPLLGAGVIEGVLNLRSLSAGRLVPARSSDGFEQELRHFSRESSDGRREAGARAALFLKGKVKGEYLLTLAYDSDKDTRDRLFRDIQPDQFYPVYGDSAIKGFDAQSTSRLYVRVDKDRSYLLWGDYTTGASSQARQLGNYNRSLTGVKEHYENGRVSANVFASYDNARQVIEELPARGISGPYVISGRNILGNSEKVELLTRDRDQASLILKTVTLARFTDYDFEPQTGRLMFRRPIPTLDADFNPNSLRITYEVEQGGDRFWVWGADGQARVSERVEVGGSYVRDENPLDRTQFASVNATVQIAEKTVLVGEAAHSDRSAGGAGGAARVELRHEGAALQGRVYAGVSDPEFNNPAAPLSLGREEAGAKFSYRVGPRTAIKAEVVHAEDTRSHTGREGGMLSVEQSLGSGWRAELGARHSVETTSNDEKQINSLRAKLTAQVLPQMSVFGEYEQDVSDAGRRIAAIGGDYQLANRSRLYGRWEVISTLGTTYALSDTTQRSATVFGIDTDYMQDGHLFSEYRLRDALSGREAEAAMGLRNRWKVAEGLTLNTNLERIHSLEGKGSNESLAVGGGVEYTARQNWKGSARVEFRNASTSDQWMVSLGLANRLSREWTFLGRELYSLTRNTGSGNATVQLANRLQFGLAYRDPVNDRLHVLGRIEHKVEKDTANVAQPLHQDAVILSTHTNYQLDKALILSGRAAAKWVTDRTNGLESRSHLQSAGARITWDIDWKWDASLQASVLRDRDGATYGGLGAELGYQLANNLWLSGGYNVFGYREPDLAGSDYTARGAFVRLRFKFDEDLFARPDASVNKTLPPPRNQEAAQ